MPDASTLADEIEGILEPLLGPHTSGRALTLACDKIGKSRAGLGAADTPALAAELVPMLRTLLGRSAAEKVRQHILEKGGRA